MKDACECAIFEECAIIESLSTEGSSSCDSTFVWIGLPLRARSGE